MPIESRPKRHSAEAWVMPDAFATTLVTLFFDEYGAEATGWDPSTILMEIEEDHRLKLPRGNFDRLMAGITIVTTDKFFTNLPDFIDLCNVLSGAGFDPTVFDPVDAEEVAWGITESMLLSPPDEDQESPFAREIIEYIQAAVEAEGLIHPPDVLKLGEIPGRAETIKASFSDDPVMFGSIYAVEEEKTGEINRTIRARIDLLIEQLDSLNLAHGSADELRRKLSRSFDSNQELD